MKIFMIAALFICGLSSPAEAQENPYLEVPLEGRFGEKITARGLEEALQTADCLGVRHIVFVLNSRGGDEFVARDFNSLMARYDNTFRFHALVREATGVAVTPLVWCETILIRTGGRIGGMNLAVDESLYPGIDRSLVLSNLALNAGEEAKRHGHSAELIQAMIDPHQSVNGWRDSAGRIQISRWIPNGIHTDDFIVQHPAGAVLTLTDRQAVQLRFARAYDGDAAGLGKELGFAGWTSMGEAGRSAMTQATVTEPAKTAVRGDREQFLVDQNRRRRNATKASLERFLSLANDWNPRLGSYSTFKEHWWGTFWEGCATDSGRLTPEARRKWRDRTDMTVAALARARGYVLEMKDLEKEALALGQEPLYAGDKLEKMRLDLEYRIALLARERDKRFKDEK